MKVAYIINQYPKISHSFIRREILALERLGVNIERFSIRPLESELKDSEDIEELKKTRVILDYGVIKSILIFSKTVLSRPLKSISALKTALVMGARSERGILRHFFYFVEACILLSWSKHLEISHIHAHFGTNSTAVTMICKYLGGPTYSFTVHGSNELDAPIALSLPKKVKHATAVFAVCHFSRSQLMRHCDNKYWSKIKIVHCSVDDHFLTKEITPVPLNNRLVCVGRLSEEKGHLFLLDAIKQLVIEGIDVEMVFAGDGQMRNRIEQHIDKLELSKYVNITGWLSGDEIIKEIIASRALILPSFMEGLPVVIMEALALGRPVIATYVSGIPELVDSQCGWLVPAGSVEHLTDAIKKLLSESGSALEKMGLNGSKRVCSHHNSVIEAGKIIDIFRSILD